MSRKMVEARIRSPMPLATSSPPRSPPVRTRPKGSRELRGDGDAAHIHVLHAPRDAYVHVEIGIAGHLVPAGIQGFCRGVLVVEQREPGAGRQVGVVAVSTAGYATR